MQGTVENCHSCAGMDFQRIVQRACAVLSYVDVFWRTTHTMLRTTALAFYTAHLGLLNVFVSYPGTVTAADHIEAEFIPGSQVKKEVYEGKCLVTEEASLY